jgi:SpoVK/Ycf46/Vps4 family AAA+-type ATPase
MDYTVIVTAEVVHHDNEKNQQDMSTQEEISAVWKDLVHLARLALLGKERDVQVFVRRLANRYKQASPELSENLGKLLREANNTGSVLRGSSVESIPVDLDSRLQLARPEYPVHLDFAPHWEPVLQEALQQLVSERMREEELYKENLHPTRTALFTGPPGVGKTLAARWIAQQLDRPLIVLDLAAVMSSFLGRTGNNVRNILDYAKGLPCVLLLDEFDAIAKRRDDDTEVGELKRLVTVLLQEIDNWPGKSLLIAATNHKELLDPAVWRRFEAVIEFGMPSLSDVRRTVELYLGEHRAIQWADILAKTLQGLSYADIERLIRRAKREAVIQSVPFDLKLRKIIHDRIGALQKTERRVLAVNLVEAGLSQREAHEWTGVSRDTIRKHQDVRS